MNLKAAWIQFCNDHHALLIGFSLGASSALLFSTLYFNASLHNSCSQSFEACQQFIIKNGGF